MSLLSRLKKYYSRYGLKNLIIEIKHIVSDYKLLKKQYYKAIGKKYVRSAYGVLMYANWEDITFNLCYSGHKGTIFSNLLNSFNHEFIFIDIGANQGLYSLLAGQNEKCVMVIAFEPVSNPFYLLNKNIAVNELEDKITPIKAAISSENGFAQISLQEGHSGAASLSEQNIIKGNKSEFIKTINVVEFDELIKSNLKIVIKLDVEGYEDVVINEIIKSQYFHNVNAIYYEIDENWNDHASIQKILQSKGFVNFEKHGSGKHYDVLALR